MTYWRLAIAIALASGVLAAAATAIVVAIVAPVIERRMTALPPSRRASVFLVLRLAPSAAGIIAGLLLVLPTFLYFEPRDTEETVAWTLVIVAAVGVASLVRAAWRALAMCRATRALGRDWRARGRQLDTIAAEPLTAFVIDDPFPRVAVVGFRHPEVFIAERVLRACTDEEVQAMVLHEQSHVAAHDNLKRLLVGSTPALGGTIARLERAWAEAVEEAADEAAVAGRPEMRMNLAQALVTIARLADAPALARCAISSFHLSGTIENRVRRLLSTPAQNQRCQSGYVIPLAGLVLFAALIASAPVLHQVVEGVVRWLP